MKAEFVNKIEVARAERDFQLKKASYDQEVNTKVYWIISLARQRFFVNVMSKMLNQITQYYVIIFVIFSLLESHIRIGL